MLQILLTLSCSVCCFCQAFLSSHFSSLLSRLALLHFVIWTFALCFCCYAFVLHTHTLTSTKSFQLLHCLTHPHSLSFSLCLAHLTRALSFLTLCALCNCFCCCRFAVIAVYWKPFKLWLTLSEGDRKRGAAFDTIIALPSSTFCACVSNMMHSPFLLFSSCTLPFGPLQHALATILLKTFQQLFALGQQNEHTKHATVKNNNSNNNEKYSKASLLCISIKVQTAIHLHHGATTTTTTTTRNWDQRQSIGKFTSTIDLTRLSHLFR